MDMFPFKMEPTSKEDGSFGCNYPAGGPQSRKKWQKSIQGEKTEQKGKQENGKGASAQMHWFANPQPEPRKPELGSEVLLTVGRVHEKRSRDPSPEAVPLVKRGQ